MLCKTCGVLAALSDGKCGLCIFLGVPKNMDETAKPQRIPDQPPPKQGNPHPPVADMVVQDLLMLQFPEGVDPDILREVIKDTEERKNVGIARYGTPLRGFDGRDTFIDLYQEILDVHVYFRKAIYETWHNSTDKTIYHPNLARLMDDYKRTLAIALEIRETINKSKPLTEECG